MTVTIRLTYENVPSRGEFTETYKDSTDLLEWLDSYANCHNIVIRSLDLDAGGDDE